MKTKALLLLLTFLFQTMVGFSCAMHESKEGSHTEEKHHHSASLKGQTEKASFQGKDHPCCKELSATLAVQAKLMPERGNINAIQPSALLHFWLWPAYSVMTVAQRSVQQLFVLRQRPPTIPIHILIRRFQI